jgi:hypothetical protein
VLIFQADGRSVGVFFAALPFLAVQEVARVKLNARFLGVDFQDSPRRRVLQCRCQSVLSGLIPKNEIVVVTKRCCVGEFFDAVADTC